MKLYEIEGKVYYKASDLRRARHVCFKGWRCKSFVKKRKLILGFDYIEHNGSIMVSKEWVDSFSSYASPSELPKLIHLGGLAEEIETREGPYFSLSDVSTVLCLEEQVILGRAVPGIHYAIHGYELRVFLTIAGLMMAIMMSDHPIKEHLLNRLFGLETKSINDQMARVCGRISGVYLIRLGLVKGLKESFEIPDSFAQTMSVHKYGQSVDVFNRYNQHLRTYRKMGIQTIELIKCYPIDPELIGQAENDLKQLFIENGMKLDNNKHTEIAIFNRNNPIMNKIPRVLAKYDKMKRDLIYELSKCETEINHLTALLEAKDRELSLLRKD